MNVKSLIWGVIGTVVWLLIIFLFAVLKGYSLPDSLNELGDALAGIVAPIAFFWLILGYVQQGKQLDQNTKALEQQEKALNLQIAEMKESVNQQRKLAEIQREQLESQRKFLKPFLIISEFKCKVLEDEFFQKVLLFTITVEVKNTDLRNLKICNIENNVLTEIIFISKNTSQNIDLIFTITDEDLDRDDNRIGDKLFFNYKDPFDNPLSDLFLLGVEIDPEVGLNENVKSIYCEKVERYINKSPQS